MSIRAIIVVLLSCRFIFWCSYGIHCIRLSLSPGEMEQSYWSSCIYGKHPITPTPTHTAHTPPTYSTPHTHTHMHTHTHTHTHSLLAGKVLLGITILGKSCHYRSSRPPRSHSSSDLISQSSGHMTAQSLQLLSLRYRTIGPLVKRTGAGEKNCSLV